MVFSCKEKKTDQRIIDATALAADLDNAHYSLGVRPQAVPLKFATPDQEGHVFVAHKPFKTVFSGIEKGLHSVERINALNRAGRVSGERIYHRAYIGETTSLIYLPLFIRGNALCDALDGKRISTLPEGGRDELAFEKPGRWRIRFVPTLCPRCGWDLQGEKESLALLCRNCDTVWKASGEGLESLDFAVVRGGNDACIHLPFWKMKVNISGLTLRSYADLVRFANLPKAIQKGWEEQELHFWSAAFKIRPQLFQRAAKSATLAQPDVVRGPRIPREKVFPVTLPSAEAFESLKVTLLDMAIPRRNILPRADRIDITPVEALLVFVPFDRGTHEYVQREMHLSLNVNALEYGRNL